MDLVSEELVRALLFLASSSWVLLWPPGQGRVPNGPVGRTGATFSSTHWKKPHCCSRGLAHVWNCRPLLGPSFWTVLVMAGWLHRQDVLLFPPEPPPARRGFPEFGRRVTESPRGLAAEGGGPPAPGCLLSAQRKKPQLPLWHL